MKINIKNNLQKDKELLVFGVFEDGSIDLEEGFKQFNAFLEELKKRHRFTGSYGEMYSLDYNFQDKEIKTVLFLGLGKEEKLNVEKLRNLAGDVLKKSKSLKVKNLEIKTFKVKGLCSFRNLKSMVEGFLLSNYKFTKYKSENEKFDIKDISIDVSSLELTLEQGERALKEGEILANNIVFTRELVNEPANILTPEELAIRIIEEGKHNGFDVEVYDEEKIIDLDMKAFMSVAKGSENTPKFIVMRYFGDKENKDNILGLVGKGLTYDSGGYSIKPTDGMVNMKCDMAGAATVIGAIKAISQMNLKVNVVAVVAACENLISGRSYKPGDIIGSMGGKTIEVRNTDCEGRLTLIDAVYYVINKENATRVIDIATLTGSVFGALGKVATGIVSNNDEFYVKLQKASEISGEKIWRFPSFEEYNELNKSQVADISNCGEAGAGAISAGLFIGEFAGETPWIHMDIAGTSWQKTETACNSIGGTAVGLRNIYYVARGLSKEQ